MERICPYLALADDGRTVADGFDAEHRCHALTPPAPLERARQVQLCLTEAHAGCERFAAARTAWLAASSGLPRVAPDVAFGRTRLILEPEAAWRTRAGAPTARFSRQTILIAIVAAAVVALFMLGRAFGILGGAAVASASPTPTPSTSPSPTASAPPSSTQGSPSLAPTATPGGSAAATQVIYTVVANDTLNKIALQFHTTVAAIEAANGLQNDTINVGQKLIIP